LTCIHKLVDHFENVNTLIYERNLALSSLDERAIESTTKVIGVEDEKIFVNVESFFFSADLNCDNALKAASM
jgi:hypothetical protein